MALTKATKYRVKRDQDSGQWRVLRYTPAHGFHPESVRRRGIEESYGTYYSKSEATKAARALNSGRRPNPVGILKPPKGKWIKASAVKFNRNGTVTVKATGKAKRRKARKR